MAFDAIRMGMMPGPADPAAMAGPPPMGPEPMGPPMGGPPPGMPDENQVLAMLLDAVTGRWGGQETQLAGEKDVLIQTLMMLAQVGAPMGPEAMVEGSMGPAEAPQGEFVE